MKKDPISVVKQILTSNPPIVNLARKQTKASSDKSYGSTITGASIGVLALAAGAAAYRLRSKRNADDDFARFWGTVKHIQVKS